MAFAAPMLVEGAAAGGSAAAASGAAEAGAAGAGRAATTGATSARTARTAPAARTAAGRADELTAQKAPRYKARRALRDEFGATGGQADDLLDAAGGRQSSPPAGDKPADEPSGTSSSAGAQRPSWSPPKAIAGPAAAGGGLVLGVLTYMAGLVFLRGGWAGLRAWGAAKFLNRVSGDASTSSAPTSTHTAPALPDGALRVMAKPGKPAVS